MTDNLIKELMEIGLSEKEARVYLASLELGPETAQKIAAKATVSRPNTYIAIESLSKRGLMSSFQKGKKKYICAQNPKLLQRILQEEKESIERKSAAYQALLPELSEITSTLENHPSVQVFDDLAGLVSVQDDIISSASHTKKLYTIAAVDEARRFITSKSMKPTWQKLQEAAVHVKSIYTSREDAQHHSTMNWESRRLDINKFPFRGEFVVYGDKVAMIAYRSRISCIIIKDKIIAETFISLFELAWEASKNKQIV